MTYSLVLTTHDGAVSVDITNLNPVFNFDFNNPIIKIPTPMDEEKPLADGAEWSVVTLNLNFCMQNIILEFTETAGIGVLGSAIRWKVNPTTVFEKMLYLSMDPQKKKFYVNGSFFCAVEIEGYRATVNPGQKDIVRHTVTLAVASMWV